MCIRREPPGIQGGSTVTLTAGVRPTLSKSTPARQWNGRWLQEEVPPYHTSKHPWKRHWDSGLLQVKNNKLDWTTNTGILYKMGQSRLQLLRRPRSFGVCRTLLKTFYGCVLASALFWFSFFALLYFFWNTLAATRSASADHSSQQQIDSITHHSHSGTLSMYICIAYAYRYLLAP